MSLTTQHLTLPSGRILDFQVSGASNGYPLVFIHGTPGSLIPVTTLVPACERLNVKLVTMSRAGYGGSTRDKGRKVVDAVDDIAELLRHLGIGECVVGGWSGGGTNIMGKIPVATRKLLTSLTGPVALACAARLQGCRAVLCIAGVAPYVDSAGRPVAGLDWLEGQGEDS